jgi:hypothetical protein
MEKIRVNRSSTQEELRRYRKCGLLHIHSHKKRYLEVISRFTRFKEFNGEKKTATKTSNMFKIVPRIGTCDAGFSSSKFNYKQESNQKLITVCGIFIVYFQG